MTPTHLGDVLALDAFLHDLPFLFPDRSTRGFPVMLGVVYPQCC
jgi:hypothetical protein